MITDKIFDELNTKHKECFKQQTRIQTKMQNLKYSLTRYPDSFHDKILKEYSFVLNKFGMVEREQLEKLYSICERKATFNIEGLLALITGVLITIFMFTFNSFSQMDISNAKTEEINSYIVGLLKLTALVIIAVFYLTWVILSWIEEIKTTKYKKMIPYLEELILTKK